MNAIAVDAGAHLRIARPSRDLAQAEAFYVGALGLEVLWRARAQTDVEHDLLIAGYPGAAWHLELTWHPGAPTTPSPTVDDLLVLYLGEPASDQLVDRLLAAGGRRVAAHNPYWDEHGTTIADPDGYRIVLCARTWSNQSGV